MARLMVVFSFSCPTCALIVRQSTTLSGRLSAAPFVLLLPRPFSFNDMSSDDPLPDLNLLLKSALDEFKKQTKTKLIGHKIFKKLEKCESAESILDVLQKQAQKFRDYREKGGVLMDKLKPIVNILHTLSTSSVLGGAINLGLVCVHSLD